MAKRDPLTYPKGGIKKYDNLRKFFEEADKHPPIGLTQGGSSRPHPGAKVAATKAKGPSYRK